MVPWRGVVTLVGATGVGIAIVVGCNALLGVEQGHARAVFTKLAAGDTFGCALKSDGTVWCWGGDDYAQLGQVDSGIESCSYESQFLPGNAGKLGTFTGPCRHAPGMVPGIATATDLAVGSTFACALLAGGQVSCWGSNGNGELGRANGPFGASGHALGACPTDFFDAGTANQIPCDPSPYPVQGLPPADKVVAGAAYACARTTGGVYCWGHAREGELDSDGGAFPGYVSTPTLAKDVPAVTELAASLDGQSACVIADAGTIFCWGRNDSQDLGDCDAGALCQVENDGGAPFAGPTSIQAGLQHSCALKADGTIWCWGSNASLAFLSGDPACFSSSVPRQNSQVGTTVPPVSFFESRATHVLAVDGDGGLWGWADNTFGELGMAPSPGTCCNYAEDSTSCSAVATAIPLDGGAVRLIATGAGFSLAATADGTVWAWGSNTNGQLGQKTSGREACPGDAGVIVGPCQWTAVSVPFP
jgi:alpha-tubulin suppressor-like RCC1 family protein